MTLDRAAVVARRVRAVAPGRVNLMGDHTDYSGGFVLPMAIDQATTVVFSRGGPVVELRSHAETQPALINLGSSAVPPIEVTPAWARYVAGVVAMMNPAVGGTGVVTSDLPIAGGLSSSAALEVAVALCLGYEGSHLGLAQTCQAAEQQASGVPCGIMDPLVCTAGLRDHALLIDCTSGQWRPVPVSTDVEVVLFDSGQPRRLAESQYASRRGELEAAAAELGQPFGHLRTVQTSELRDLTAVSRRRARHVVTENERVHEFADALATHDYVAAGQAMAASHRSLRDDFEVSTPILDALVEDLMAQHGVFGARLTGAGFGGFVVALTQPGVAGRLNRGRVTRAAPGATIEAFE